MMVIKLKLNLSFITLRVVIITAKFICCEIISHVFAYLKSQKFTQLVTVKKLIILRILALAVTAVIHGIQLTVKIV